MFRLDSHVHSHYSMDGILPPQRIIKITLFKSGRVKRLYILTHPERWALNDAEWLLGCIKDVVFNVGKKVLRRERR